jgi:nucleoside-diphosphate-sugar epimerase
MNPTSTTPKRIALIGGAGFIGHNMALQLKDRGHHVEIVDGLQINNLLSLAGTKTGLNNRELYMKMLHDRLDLLHGADIPMHVQDARDYHALSRILELIKPQVVVHLAAVAHANKSNKDPFSTFDHSLRTLENALDWARDRQPQMERFIFFSSSMVYGHFKTPEVSEDHSLDSIGIYGALKVAGEKIVQAYQQVFGLPYTIIRPSALYGPRCVSRRVGQIFIENARAGLPLRMEGDGAEKLDFTYIDDLVEGVALAIEKPAAINQVFNITYGQSRSIRELADVIRTYFPNITIQNVERDNLMPFRGTLSIQKAKDLLGYQPENPIDVGIPKYIESYQPLQNYASV